MWKELTAAIIGTGEGNGNPLQCSCLENPRDRGAWWAAVWSHRVRHDWSDLAEAAAAALQALAPLTKANKAPYLSTLLQSSPVNRACLGKEMPISFISLHSFIWLVKSESNICNMKEIRKQKVKEMWQRNKQFIKQNLLKALWDPQKDGAFINQERKLWKDKKVQEKTLENKICKR